MKTALLTLLFALHLLPSAFSQFVSDVPLKDIDAEYISIDPGGYKSNKVSINLDFGQHHVPFSPKERLIKDEGGKPIEFNSMMDALNFLDKFGYELVEVITVNTDSSSSSSYILRRKK